MNNYHSHTQYCDGRATMSEIAGAAFSAGFKEWGCSPHSPICCESGANMKAGDVEAYLAETETLKNRYAGVMKILAGMEVDYISDDFGPHISYFRNLPIDYIIGSVHFVPTRAGKPVDVDGPSERFLKFLDSEFDGDLRYVVDKYFSSELEMLEKGGFSIIGHLDKIGDNGSAEYPTLEDESWYGELVEKVIAKAVAKGVVIEINTKKYESEKRFFPALRWWPLLKKNGAKLVLSTDAHYPGKVASGYYEALSYLRQYDMEHQLVDSTKFAVKRDA